MFLEQGVPFNSSMFSDVRILTVDNDRDSGALCTVLFESYSATVMAAESIQEALNLLNQFVPDILICEARFLGESVNLLIQQVRSIAQDKNKLIPVFITSTCPVTNLTESLKGKIEAYQIKPIDLDQFVTEVWNLIFLSKITQPPTIHGWMTRLDVDKTSFCFEEVA
jgi:response regulator RpfG family c-di-GMP phosphodiesterase